MATAATHTTEQISSGVDTSVEQNKLEIIKDSRHIKIYSALTIGLLMIFGKKNHITNPVKA